MRLTYVLLSPTFGMHQYTADLANRMARAGHTVHLVTSERYPSGRYLPTVQVHTPVQTENTGLSIRSLEWRGLRRVAEAVRATQPDLVHITGPHVWNTPLLSRLRRWGIPTVHTLHDLEPHPGTSYGPLLHLWNRAVTRHADHILVHGQRYRQLLIAQGVPAERVTYTPLLHLFLGCEWCAREGELTRGVSYDPYVLFFGRIEGYKGVHHLITAWAMMGGTSGHETRLVLAGPGDLGRFWAATIPPRVEVRDRLIADEEALELFRHCSLVVFPYTGATQSALIPAAYYFRKPVIVSPSGALPEYVEEGRTGWVVNVQHPPSFARCLAAALADHERLIAMGSAGRAWYDSKRRVEEKTLLTMYERLAANGK